ncbi:MAG: phosphoketolase family protein, partial [bacterium]|nr:phosphoketolase family protein [bacterium]
PLLKRPLQRSDLKRKIVGHWGTVPGQNFIYTHLNRVINKYDLNMIYISGPGHGGNSIVSHVYLEGTYSEVYPSVSYDEAGLKKLFKQFSFPGGISSHVAPETPGSINEGGELGYSLAHGFGAVFDNPNLIATVVVGDGEAETASLATSWHSNKFLNPKNDGAVLPILHLNGFKISNPTIFSRISEDELLSFFHGCGWDPVIVSGEEPMKMHQAMAKALDNAIEKIQKIQKDAREKDNNKRPFWPMIILRTPKGWTGPKIVNNKQIEGTFRAHQVPIDMSGEDHLTLLENWLRSYHPENLFDKNGALIKELRDLAPKGDKRMGSNPNANGGKLLKDLILPDFRDYALHIKEPGSVVAQDMVELGKYVRDVYKLNDKNRNFRIFGPDETLSNRLGHVFDDENRAWMGSLKNSDEFLARDGRVMDGMLSENMCQGWLEGYLLTGRHGFFHSYEAFVRVIDSMASQHAKWLKICSQLTWREEISSLNYILTSNVWQQDHNGYTHQDPGFLDHMANKKADVARMYLPPDTNCLLSCFEHCMKSKDYINVLVTSKHPTPQWLTMEQAVKHCTEGVGIWDFASNDQEQEPDVIMACCGSTPTIESLAAVSILREHLPKLKIRFINVVDLFKLQSNNKHPHGLTDDEYNSLFTKKKPIIFNFHGYPSLIHELLYERENHNIVVKGYIEEGSITTPFDMRVQNEIDRFHLVIEVCKIVPNLGSKGVYLTKLMKEKLIEHKEYINEYGMDMPEVANWQWNEKK